MAGGTVLVKEVSFVDFSVLLVELNRPSSLNAVNKDVIHELNEVFQLCESSQHIKLLVFTGAGRAFCAGGDVVFLSKLVKENGESAARSFLSSEYAMLKRLQALKIPTIAIADGPAIGAGFGMWYACKIRISTSRAIFAMPEVSIGLSPDVGSTHFLTMLPGSLGLYFALTGNRLDHDTVQSFGLATHSMSSESIPEFLSLSFLTPDTQISIQSLSELLKDFEYKPINSSNPLTSPDTSIRRSIDSVFSAPALQEIFVRLGRDNTDWAKETLKTLKAACPTALSFTFRLMREGYDDSNDEYAWENAVGREKESNIILASRPDFQEGVRCKLKDKNDTPRWDPTSIEEVRQIREDQLRAAM